ncbi:MAG: Hint domain-containing protein, partial [Acetobacteraceae bacterium]|nr:Hint domain-containing protein [Acetobacteraceae bacterium]
GDDADTLSGGDGNDMLAGGNGSDNMFGGNDADTLDGGAGNDSLNGGDDADTLDGGAGDDTLTGGDGSDFVSYANATGSVTVDLSAPAPNASGADGDDQLSGVENVIGSNSDDSIRGDGGANTILGGDGVDSLVGGGGNDWLDFGAGNDMFEYLTSGVDGNLTLLGGTGTNELNLGEGWSSGPEAIGFTNYQSGSTTIYTQGWNVVCFAEGTRIVTPNGEDAVENLRAGDMVLAMRDGQAGFEPLRWVGFMDVAVPRNAAMAAKTAPILIKAGALAPGMPARDLRVSPDHAMEVDGHLIPAKHLVNGASIIQETWCRRVRYFHLELEAHGLLLSEGTWSESYLDDGNRHAFNNAAITGLFLDFEAGRSKGQYDHQACLPVLRHGLKLDEIHGRLALRAEELARGAKGWRRG